MHRTYSHQLTTSISFCNELLKEINDSLNHLNQLKVLNNHSFIHSLIIKLERV